MCARACAPRRYASHAISLVKQARFSLVRQALFSQAHSSDSQTRGRLSHIFFFSRLKEPASKMWQALCRLEAEETLCVSALTL